MTPEQHALPAVGAHLALPEGLEKPAEEEGVGARVHCQPLVAPCQVQPPLLAFHGFIGLEGCERLCDVPHLSPGRASSARIQKRGTASSHTALQPVPVPAREEVGATQTPALLGASPCRHLLCPQWLQLSSSTQVWEPCLVPAAVLEESHRDAFGGMRQMSQQSGYEQL